MYIIVDVVGLTEILSKRGDFGMYVDITFPNNSIAEMPKTGLFLSAESWVLRSIGYAEDHL